MSYWFRDNFKEMISVEDFFENHYEDKLVFEVPDEMPWKDLVDRLYVKFGLISSTDPQTGELTVLFEPFKEYIIANYGELEMNPLIAYIDKDGATRINFTKYHRKLQSLLASKQYTYTTLLDSTEFDYNPIWNVDSHEVSTENRDKKQEDTIHGAKSNTKTMGTKVTTTTPPLVKLTEDVDTRTDYDQLESMQDWTEGGVTLIDNAGKFTINKHQNNQMNDSTFVDHDRDINVESGNKTTHHYDKVKTTTTPELVNNGAGTTTENGYVDNEKEAPYKDSKYTAAYKDEINIVRQGNIGTKTTQSMINEERDVAKFNLLKIICKDIIKEITLNVYY